MKHCYGEDYKVKIAQTPKGGGALTSNKQYWEVPLDGMGFLACLQ